MTKSQGEKENPTEIKRVNASWIGHILRRNCTPPTPALNIKHVIKGKKEGRREVMGRRGRRLQQLLDDLKKKRRYCKLKDETVERTLWRTHFGTGNSGTAVRQKIASLTRCVDMAWTVLIRVISLTTLGVFQNTRNLCVPNDI